MINHFRTVLLNLPGPKSPVTDVPSDVYVPRYTPVVLQGKLPIVDHALFGDCLTDEDRERKVFQLLRLVNASDLKHRLVENDTRLTYNYDNIGLGCYEDTGSIQYSVEKVHEFNDSTLEYLFADDNELFMHYNARTYVDQMSAVVVGYVKKLEGQRAS